MSTPEITSGVLAKLSPFGSGISKSLLTPCRRVGLSRKRKSSTPNSIVKILSEDANISDTSFTGTSNSTPLNHKNSIPKKKNLNFDHSVLKEVTDQKCSNGDETSCKKKLAKSFSADLLNEEPTEKDTVEVITVKALIHNSSEGVLASDIIESVEKENISEVVRQTEVIQINSLNAKLEVTKEGTKCDKKYNSDHPKYKNSKDFKTKNEKLDKEIYVVSDHSIKECKVTLRKLSNNEVEFNVNKTEKGCDIVNQDYNVGKGQSEEPIVKHKKRSFVLIDDDEDDFFTSSPKYCLSSLNVDTKTKKETKLEKKRSTEIQRKHSLNLNDDDDDAFTSTPEREKNEKKDLIQRVKNMEYQVKDKKKKLEDLNQAAVYRKKHNVEELKALTETWRSGCISGLKGLLTQLQSHGPMDMPTLLSKLSISSDACSKLFLDTKNNQ